MSAKRFARVLIATANLPLIAAALLMVVDGCSSSSPQVPASQTSQATIATAAPTPVTPAFPKTSVLLFDVSPEPSVHALDSVAGDAFVDWLDNGKRIVAYNWADHAYEIWGIDGTTADRLYTTFAPQPAGNRRTEWAEVLPGGASVLLQNDSGSPRLYDVASGAFNDFSPPAGQNVYFTGSPDGSRLIFNNIVEGRSTVMTSDLDGANARVLVANPGGSVGMMDDHAVSPDGKYLLLESSSNSDTRWRWDDIVTDVNGHTVWSFALPETEGGVRPGVSASWAGSDRLLVTQTKAEGDAFRTTAEFVSVPSSAATQAPDVLAQQLVSLSPDGRHAIMSLGDGAAPWDRRCAIVSIDATDGSIEELASATPTAADFQTVFCTSVSWTADGNQAVVSAGGT
jgi:hypothetical protein